MFRRRRYQSGSPKRKRGDRMLKLLSLLWRDERHEESAATGPAKLRAMRSGSHDGVVNLVD